MIKKFGKKEIILVVHNIRSIYNVGSIFRTADAVGVARIILTGYSPTPIDRFGRERKGLAKVALGAEKYVEWDYDRDIFSVMDKYKNEGYEIVALEQDPRAIDYRSFRSSPKMVLILGNEPLGIEALVLEKCDTIVEIPMYGKKESLNVAVATGVMLYLLADF